MGCRFSPVVDLANKNAIPVLVHSVVQRDLIGELIDRWPLTVLNRARVNFRFLKCFPKFHERSWLIQLLLGCLDIFFFNDKFGPVLVALGKENRDRRIGIDAAACEQKHFLPGLGDCSVGCNCNDLSGEETLISQERTNIILRCRYKGLRKQCNEICLIVSGRKHCANVEFFLCEWGCDGDQIKPFCIVCNIGKDTELKVLEFHSIGGGHIDIRHSNAAFTSILPSLLRPSKKKVGTRIYN